MTTADATFTAADDLNNWLYLDYKDDHGFNDITTVNTSNPNNLNSFTNIDIFNQPLASVNNNHTVNNPINYNQDLIDPLQPVSIDNDPFGAGFLDQPIQQQQQQSQLPSQNTNYTTFQVDQSFDILNAPIPNLLDDAATISSTSSPETPDDDLQPYLTDDSISFQTQSFPAQRLNLDVFPNMGPLMTDNNNRQSQSQPQQSQVQSRSQSQDSSESPKARKRTGRKQSESRISLPELYNRMGLGENHDEARIREQRVLGILKQQGFQLGEKTWIRDTSEYERKKIIDEIYRQTWEDYHYSKELIEVIIRRGSYYLMQGRLRRIRRASASAQKKEAMMARLQLKKAEEQAQNQNQNIDQSQIQVQSS